MQPTPIIIFEDDDVLLVNKPTGIVYNEYEKLYATYKAAHRLDQRVSGLLVYAKNSEAHAKLSNDFATKRVSKTYVAVVANKPEQDKATLEDMLYHNKKLGKSFVSKEENKNNKKAILEYEIQQSSIKYHLLKIKLITGRFHQIRCQLAHIKCPVVGDLKYGYARSTADGSIFLQSNAISFIHPTTNEKMEFKLPLPEIWKKFGFE